MKSKITLSIALALSVVLLSLMRSDSTANAAPPQRSKFGTGVVTPSAGQILRVTLVGNAADDILIAGLFRWTRYGAPVCSGTPAVCRHTIESQGSTPVIMLENGALSADFNGDGDAIKVVVESNRRNTQVTVTAQIIDTVTGEVKDTFFCPNSDQEQ